MGLTIHYRLQSSAADAAVAAAQIARLRAAARGLPFAHVGALLELTGQDCDPARRNAACPRLWLLLQAQCTLSDPRAAEGRYRVHPQHVIAFGCDPGPGCEAAHFGLCRYPEQIEVGPRGAAPPRRIPTRLPAWSWASFCKTQYARAAGGGAQQGPDCGHWAIVDLLDEADQLGLLAAVHDEAGCWQSRQLLRQTLGLARPPA
jgi:hypothetical protein